MLPVSTGLNEHQLLTCIVLLAVRIELSYCKKKKKNYNDSQLNNRSEGLMVWSLFVELQK